MSNLSYFRIAGAINLLPPKAITYYDPVDEESLNFLQLGSETSFNLDPITKPDQRGGQIHLGYSASLQVYPLQNTFNMYSWAIPERIEKLQGRYVRTILVLGNSETWVHKPADLGTLLTDAGYSATLSENFITKCSNATSSMVIDFGENLTFNASIEGVELRPRMVVKSSGFLKSLVNVNTPGDESLAEGQARMFFK